MSTREKAVYDEVLMDSPVPSLTEMIDIEHSSSSILRSSNLPKTISFETKSSSEDDRSQDVSSFDSENKKRKESKVKRMTRGVKKMFKRRRHDSEIEVVIDEHVPGSFIRGTIFDRIMLRRRKNNDEDFIFWTLVLLGSILALGILVCITFYLSQTDFFTGHQTDLLGTTIDERFTVVSQMDTSAKIFLKSGYSNIPHAEAVIALEHGVLKIGRTSTAEEVQDFYGCKLYRNGTVMYTNEIDVPKITADHVYANNAIVFNDGTSMTTAADISGGLKQQGDLNFASTKGSIISSTGGSERMRINVDGTVIFPDPTAKAPLSPTQVGLVFNAPQQKFTLAADFEFLHSATRSVITTPLLLHINTNKVVLGDSSTNDDEAVLFSLRDLDSVEARDKGATPFQIQGQSISGKVDGGHLLLSGGSSEATGGSVVIAGGTSSGKDAASGVVKIHAGTYASDAFQGETWIGNPSFLSETTLRGNVFFNPDSTDASLSVTVDNTMIITGSSLTVDSKKVLVGNTTKTEQVEIQGKSVVVTSPRVQIGDEIKTTQLDLAGQTIILSGAKVQVGNALDNNHSVLMQGGLVELQAFEKVLIGANSNTTVTEIRGRVQLGENIEVQIWDGNVHLSGSQLFLGNAEKTQSSSLSGKEVLIGMASKTVKIGDESTRNVSMAANIITIEAKDTLVVGKNDGVSTQLVGHDVNIESENDLKIGFETTKALFIGNEKTVMTTVVESYEARAVKTVSISAHTVTLSGKDLKFIGDSIVVGENAASIHVGHTQGSTSPTEIFLGSEDSTIHLMGTVTLNGNEFKNTRRLTEETVPSSLVGTFSAASTTISLHSKEETTIFLLPDLQESSSKWTYEVESGRIVYMSSDDDTTHFQVSFSMHAVRIISEKKEDSMLRCRLTQEIKDALIVILEFSSRITPQHDDHDDLYPSFSSTGILTITHSSSSFLQLTCRTNAGKNEDDSKLIIDRLQLAFLAV